MATLSQFPVFKSLADPNLAAEPAAIFSEAHEASKHGVFQNPHGDGLVVTRYQTLSYGMRQPEFQAQNRALRKTGPNADNALSKLFDNHPVFMNEPVHKPTR